MKSFISVFMSFVVAVCFGIYPVTYEPLTDGAKLDFVVVSDIHMEGNNTKRFERFPKALLDINGNSRKNDALVMLGDNTMNGQHIEHIFLTLSLKLFNDIENNLIAMGNHEIFTEENGYEKGSKKFMKYGEMITGLEIEKPYYYDVIEDYYFIILGSEADMGVQAYISPEQLSWLDSTLAKATAEGKPAFVFCHFPLKDTVRNAWSEGLIGEQSEEIFGILSKYKNVFYFSGHLHNAIDYSDIIVKNGVTFVDVTSLLSDNSTHGIPSVGMGYCVEVTENSVELRVRDFIDGEWVEGFEYTAKLDK